MHKDFLKPDRIERLKSRYIKSKLTTAEEKYLREQCAIAKRLDGNRCRNPYHGEWISTIFGLDVLRTEVARRIDPDHLLGRGQDYLHHNYVCALCGVCHEWTTNGISLKNLGYLNNNIVRIIILSARKTEKDFRFDDALARLIAREYPKLTPALCHAFGIEK